MLLLSVLHFVFRDSITVESRQCATRNGMRKKRSLRVQSKVNWEIAIASQGRSRWNGRLQNFRRFTRKCFEHNDLDSRSFFAEACTSIWIVALFKNICKSGAVEEKLKSVEGVDMLIGSKLTREAYAKFMKFRLERSEETYCLSITRSDAI